MTKAKKERRTEDEKYTQPEHRKTDGPQDCRSVDIERTNAVEDDHQLNGASEQFCWREFRGGLNTAVENNGCMMSDDD